MKTTKALFLDRDGVILKMVYNLESGYIHTALNEKQVKLVEGIIPLLKLAKKRGYKIINISNQPNIGLKRISVGNFNKVHQKMETLLKTKNIVLDEFYYCFHHPFAQIKQYKKNCQCRKPKTLLFRKAIKKYSIDAKNSWLIGDGVFDIIAGSKVGVRTIFLINLHESEYLRILESQLNGVKPSFIVKNLKKAAIIIDEIS